MSSLADSNGNNTKSFANRKQSGRHSAASLGSAVWESGDKVNLDFTQLIRKFIKLNSFNRTNTYPKIPERFRLRSTDGTPPMLAQIGTQLQSPSTPNKIRSVSLHGQSTTTPLLTKVSPNNHLNNSNNKTNDNSKDGKEQSKEEEVIYFWYKPTEVEI